MPNHTTFTPPLGSLTFEGSHFEDEFAALHDVRVADLPVRDGPAVERDRLHVLVLL